MANFVFGTVLVAMLSGAIRVLPEFVPWNKIVEPRFERSGLSFALLHRRLGPLG